MSIQAKQLEISYYLGQILGFIEANAKNKTTQREIEIYDADTKEIITKQKTATNLMAIGIKYNRTGNTDPKKIGIIDRNILKQKIEEIDKYDTGCVLVIEEEAPNKFKMFVMPALTEFIKNMEKVVQTVNKENNENTVENQEPKNNYIKVNKGLNIPLTNDPKLNLILIGLLIVGGSITIKALGEFLIDTFIVGQEKLLQIFTIMTGKTITNISDLEQTSVTIATLAQRQYDANHLVQVSETISQMAQQNTELQQKLADAVNGTIENATPSIADAITGAKLQQFVSDWFNIFNSLGDAIFGQASAMGDVFGIVLAILSLFGLIALTVRAFTGLFKFMLGRKEHYVQLENEQMDNKKRSKVGLVAAIFLMVGAIFTRISSGVSLIGSILAKGINGLMNLIFKTKQEAFDIKSMITKITTFLKNIVSYVGVNIGKIVLSIVGIAKGGIVGIVNLIKRNQNVKQTNVTEADLKFAYTTGKATTALKSI